MVHIVHNLDADYQGRIYLDGDQPWERLNYWTELPTELTIDPHWVQKVCNPSRCALMQSDQWATVSKTYRNEILAENSLKSILETKPRPFAFPNGVDDGKIRANLARLSGQKIEKKKILEEFFNISTDASNIDEYILFGFVGRICAQKGVHLILETVETVLQMTNSKARFVIGGMIDGSEYSKYCASLMQKLSEKYPRNFWAKPFEFFKNGPALNRAADFFLMPSFFEPGGIVQHEALIAGTPVIAFRTGGLNDSIDEFCVETGEGNGFLFNSHNTWDYTKAIERALATYSNHYGYQSLRQACESSFINIQRVTKAWRGEFYRLFGKVSIDLRLFDSSQSFDDLRKRYDNPTPHQIKINDPHLNFLHVFFKMSADNWEKEHHLTLNDETGEWTFNGFKLPENEFKLFIDGRDWLMTNRTPLCREQGYVNNLLRIHGENLV